MVEVCVWNMNGIGELGKKSRKMPRVNWVIVLITSYSDCKLRRWAVKKLDMSVEICFSMFLFYFNLLTGRTCRPARKLDFISQIVCFLFYIPSIRSHYSPHQHCLLFWWPFITYCTPFHSLPNLSHRIPWQVLTYFIILDPCSSICIDSSLLVRTPRLLRCHRRRETWSR